MKYYIEYSCTPSFIGYVKLPHQEIWGSINSLDRYIFNKLIFARIAIIHKHLTKPHFICKIKHE